MHDETVWQMQVTSMFFAYFIQWSHIPSNHQQRITHKVGFNLVHPFVNPVLHKHLITLQLSVIHQPRFWNLTLNNWIAWKQAIQKSLPSILPTSNKGWLGRVHHRDLPKHAVTNLSVPLGCDKKIFPFPLQTLSTKLFTSDKSKALRKHSIYL